MRTRKAILPDAQQIHDLIAGYSGDGTLLPRTLPEICENVRDFVVLLVYGELRRIVRRSLAGQTSCHTLQPTELVHETYLRMARRDSVARQDFTRFFAMAAQMMKQIVADHARKLQRLE